MIRTTDPRQTSPAAPDVGGMLKLRSRAPLRARKPQVACDVGLFSDDASQLDLVEMCMDPADTGEDFDQTAI